MSLSTNSTVLDFDVLLDANPNYLPQSNNVKLVVKSIAESVLYRKEAVQSKNSSSFTFKVNTDTYFVDRGVLINIENLPLKVSLKDATGIVSDGVENATEYDFHTKLFQDYKYLCMKQFGFHNCIDSISTNVDGEIITTSKVSESLQIVSKGYDEDSLNKYFDCSQPDYVYDDSLMVDSINYVPSFDVKNTKCLVKKPPSALDINSPYSSVTNSKNNSRTPLFYSFERGGDIALTTSKHSVSLSNLSFWLPFNIWSVNSESNISLYNASDISITVNLNPQWISRLFNIVSIVNPVSFLKTNRYKFELDTSKFTANSVGEINSYIKLYRAPQQIENLRNLKSSYIIEYPKVELDMRTTNVSFSNNKSTSVINSTPFDLRAIPSKVFIAVVPKCDTEDDYMLNNNHFCRFNSLKVELFGQKTDIASGNGSEILYNLSKKNGLSMNKETALYTLGFPIILDVSDDLACKTNSYIGINTANSSGKYTLRIEGDVTRLHCDDNTVSSHTQLAKIYELKCIFTYVAYFAYNLLGRKFSQIESLSSTELQTLNARMDNLYENLVPRINVIGGGGWNLGYAWR